MEGINVIVHHFGSKQDFTTKKKALVEKWGRILNIGETFL